MTRDTNDWYRWPCPYCGKLMERAASNTDGGGWHVELQDAMDCPGPGAKLGWTRWVGA